MSMKLGLKTKKVTHKKQYSIICTMITYLCKVEDFSKERNRSRKCHSNPN